MTLVRQVTILTFSFILVGLGLMTAAVIWASNTREFVNRSITVPGTVVGLEYHGIGKNGGYVTTFTFADPTGKAHTVQTDYAEDPAPFPVGARISVAYLPNDPDSAQILSFKTLWLWPAIVGGFGVVVTGVGALALFSVCKYRRGHAALQWAIISLK